MQKFFIKIQIFSVTLYFLIICGTLCTGRRAPCNREVHFFRDFCLGYQERASPLGTGIPQWDKKQAALKIVALKLVDTTCSFTKVKVLKECYTRDGGNLLRCEQNFLPETQGEANLERKVKVLVIHSFPTHFQSHGL